MLRFFAFLTLAALILGGACWLLLGRPAPGPDFVAARGAVAADGPRSTKVLKRFQPEPPKGNIPEPVRRIPSASRNGSLADLEAESLGRWVVKKGAGGFVTKMAEGRLPPLAPTPEASAKALLDRFGHLVFGLDPGAAGSAEVIREAETTEVVFPLEASGLPVFGARHKQTYDADGNLIYVVSDSLPSQVPNSTPVLSPEQAAASAREGLLQYLGAADRARNEQAYPLGLFLNGGRLMYRLVNGALSLVYRYEFSLAAPAYGDMEAMVDANLGTAVIMQNISRK